jgi:hypothetical protein
MNFNWYGKLFNSFEWINAFRYGPSNYDFEVGYSHEVWDGGPDLRLKIKGYHFDVGSNLRGWNGGAELKSRDGMFVLKYEAGYDRIDETYQTVGAYVNVGFQIEDVLKGESPFTTPTPIFRSPRNLKHMLTQTVKRDWHQPTAVVVTRPGQGGGCGNLDKFLGSVLMSTTPSLNSYFSGIVPFSSVPNTCLDPGAIITVEFDYAFDVNPQESFWYVEVADGRPLGWNVELNNRYATVSYGQSGHIIASLFIWNPATGYFLGQSVFTTSGADPAALYIGGSDSLRRTSTLTVTNVVIRFNQKSPL